jgi:hypothetical protein
VERLPNRIGADQKEAILSRFIHLLILFRLAAKAGASRREIFEKAFAAWK